MSQFQIKENIAVEAENIGGISKKKVKLAPGINVLTGKNASNRTSFLKSLAAAQGSQNISLKGDKNAGSVQLNFNDEKYERKIKQKGGTLQFEGTTPLNERDTELAELFAFLFERNRVRRAIREDKGLYDIVMEPVDTDEIEREIASLKDRRSQKEDEFERLQAQRERLPSLKQRRQQLESDIEELEERIEDKQSQIDEVSGKVDETKEQQNKIESHLNDLRSKQSELQKVESKIETAESTISQLEDELETTQAKLDDVEQVNPERISDLEAELSQLHQQHARKESMMNELQNIIQFNQDMLQEETAGETVSSVIDSQEPSKVTDPLTQTADGVVCWTCGSETSQTEIENTVEKLQSVHQDLYAERKRISEDIEDCKEEKRKLEQKQNEREHLSDTVSDITERLEQHQTQLDSLNDQKETLVAEIAELEETIESLRNEKEEEVLDRHQELNRLKIDLENKQQELESTTEEISDIEDEVARIETVEEEIENIDHQLEQLRQRVEKIEQQIIEQFNDHMDEILGVLGYENIERIWIESVESDNGGYASRALDRDVQFELHVVRTGDDGTVYEDSVRHLSESEREVTGIILALSGYLTYDVHERVPFMLMDSLEALDSSRINRLLDYISEYADNLVVALLPEDAEELTVPYTSISDF